MLGPVTIVLCFSDPVHSEAIASKLRVIAPHIKFIVCADYHDFQEAISKGHEIECFIIEKQFKHGPAYNLIKQLKENDYYKKSGIVLFTPDKNKLSNDLLELNLTYIFDHSTSITDLIKNVAKIILSELREPSSIPEHFNILVLDDNPDILEVISDYLINLGHHHFHLCHSVKESLKLLRQKDFDLLLLDWNLEDGSYADVLDYIKKEDLSPRTKTASVVVITGRDDVDDIMTLHNYGVNNSIIKPFDFDEFQEKVIYAIEKK